VSIYQWHWKLRSPPSALWESISDTQRVNRAIGQPPWIFTETPDPLGGSLRTGSFRFLGLLPIEWDEHPYEWVEGREMSVVRTYHRGPVKEIVSRVTLEPDAAGGTTLTHTLDVTPRGILGRLLAPLEIGWKTRRAFDRVYREIDRHAVEKVAAFPETRTPPVRGAETTLAEARSRLQAAGVEPALVERLEDHLLGAADRDLLRIRAFDLADRWGADRRRVLALLLLATRAGIVEMSWDLVCPQCRGAKSTSPRLDSLSSEVHCGSCNIRFDTDFARSVEITFKPHRGIRVLEAGDYCVGGPGNTRHVVLQRRIPPHAIVFADIHLAAGEYRVRGPRIAGAGCTVRVAPGEMLRPGVRMALPARRDVEETHEVTPGSQRFTFHNPEAFEQLVLIEHTAWNHQVTTAALVGTVPEFRELFSSEVPPPGTATATGRLAFLFTDLEGSTSWYERLGEAVAFRLVREHFDFLAAHIGAERGAVVKRIGDAVMAVFPTGEDAMRAALRIQRDLARPHQERGGAEALHVIRVKIGLHEGPCYAVNLDDRFDYFGTTVNIAARMQAAALSEEIVLDEELAASPAVRQVLETEPHSSRKSDATLKGLSRTFRLVRVRAELRGAAPRSGSTATGDRGVPTAK